MPVGHTASHVSLNYEDSLKSPNRRFNFFCYSGSNTLTADLCNEQVLKEKMMVYFISFQTSCLDFGFVLDWIASMSDTITELILTCMN